ncbi:MAG: NAD(P)/FAD-dependent oxidoreductase, partial [Bacillota bacterium]
MATGGTTNPEVVVIGAGPAGLAAALYAGRARLSTVVLERGATGGQAATTHLIENYPGFPEGITGPELIQRMEQQARKFGADFRYADVRGIAKSDGGILIHSIEGDIHTAAAIVATGTEPMRLGVPGEDRLRGAGVSYCATCDGAFFRDKHVLVIGGGDSAIVEALFLTRFAS